MRVRLVIFVILVSLFPSNAHAGLDGSSRIGADIKLFRPANANVFLFGWRFHYNPSEAFSVGGAGYTGQLTGTGETGSFSYGGISIALNLGITQTTRLEFGLLAGGGGGFRSSGTSEGGLAVEPTLSIAFSVGRNVASALTAGYLYMPTSTTSTGITFGLRFEFLADRAVVYVPHPNATPPSTQGSPQSAQPVRPSPTAQN